LSLGQWLLTPTVGLYTLYDSNIFGSPTHPLSGPAFHFHPSLLADRNTGIYETQLYGNIDSTVYPTQSSSIDTFNEQGGFRQTYSPLPDLVFTAHGDYTHNTNASVLSNSTTPSVSTIPNPIVSPATPAPTGAEGVVAAQQTVVSPNDTYTGTFSAYKQFNRAFLSLGSTLTDTIFEKTPNSDVSQETYYGSGGFWFTPLLYTFASGSDGTSHPAVGSSANSYLAKGGIGSDQIGLFQGSIYYGQQGTIVADGGGTAGGDLYGGIISYFPTTPWTMSFSVDRQRNISNITATTPLALAGLQLAAVGVSVNTSTQTTAMTFRSNYQWSDQTSIFGVVSDTLIAYLGSSRVDTSWVASVGIRQQVEHNLTLSFDYNYTRFLSEQPMTSFNRNIVTVGALYNF
jgi:opacity protein-like surface antigen